MEPYNEPVCVVLIIDEIAEDEARRYVGGALPVLVILKDRHEYISTMLARRPQVVVLMGSNDELLQQSCQLIASLFSTSSPTVVSLNVNDARAGSRRLVVHQLGTGATARINALEDISIPRIA